MNKFQQKIGNALRKKREALGWSQEALAEYLRMHRTYYSAIERGEKNLTLKTLRRICDALEVLPSTILREAE